MISLCHAWRISVFRVFIYVTKRDDGVSKSYLSIATNVDVCWHPRKTFCGGPESPTNFRETRTQTGKATNNRWSSIIFSRERILPAHSASPDEGESKMPETLVSAAGFHLRAGISVGSSQSSNPNLGYVFRQWTAVCATCLYMFSWVEVLVRKSAFSSFLAYTHSRIIYVCNTRILNKAAVVVERV